MEFYNIEKQKTHHNVKPTMNSTNSQVKSNELWQLSYHCKKDTTMFHSLSYDATFDSGSPYQQFMVFGKCQRTGKYPQRTNDLSASRFFDQFFGFLKLLVQVKNRFLDLLFFRGMAGQSWVHIPAAALYLAVLSLQKRATAPPHWFEL